MPSIRVTLGIGFPAANHEDILEIDEMEWEACETDLERENLMEEYWRDWSNNYIDGGVELIED